MGGGKTGGQFDQGGDWNGDLARATLRGSAAVFVVKFEGLAIGVEAADFKAVSVDVAALVEFEFGYWRPVSCARNLGSGFLRRKLFSLGGCCLIVHFI